MEINLNFDAKLFNTNFEKVWKDKSRYLHLYGTASGGKSYDVATKILLRMMQEQPHTFLVCRKVADKIKNSTFMQFKERVSAFGLEKLFTFNKSDYSIKCKNGNQIIHSGLDDVDKLKSIVGITGIWIEEAIETCKDDFMQLDLRMRSNSPYYEQMILTYNTNDINSYLKTDFHDNIFDGSSLHFYKYQDNKFLNERARTVLDNLVNIDPVFYKIYGLGEWAAITGIIYPNYVIDNYFPSTYSVYGLDYGFEHPCALMEVSVVGKDSYTKTHIYESGMNHSDLLDRMNGLNLAKSKELFISPERKDLIDFLRNSGYNALTAKTGAGSVFDGIMFVKQFKKHLQPQDIDLINEHKSYKWKTDKNGNPITPEQPVKFKDDGVDAERYGLYSGFFDKVSLSSNIAYNSIVKKNNRFSLINGY